MKRMVALVLFCLLILGSCGQAVSSGAGTPGEASARQPEKAGIQAGSYEGSGKAYHGDITVSVKLEKEGKIESVEVHPHQETDGIGTVAVEKIPGRIVEEQSLAVDAVSGATVTCNGIIQAAAMAIQAAGADPADFGYTAPAPKKTTGQVRPGSGPLPEKAPKTGSITVNDAKGRQVTIETPVSTYAVSTMDVVDFIVPLKGKEAFNMLVGTGNSGGKKAYDEIYFPMFTDLQARVGIISEHNAPFDLEMILNRQPDVVIVNSAMQAHKHILDIEPQLTQAGIPIVLIDVPSTVDTSVQKTIALLGDLFGEKEKAAAANAELDGLFDLIRTKNLSARTDKPSVYYEKSGYSEIYGSTSGSNSSGWGALVAFAGGENIADAVLQESGGGKSGGKGGSQTLDPEYVLQADPDYIVLSGINNLGLGAKPAAEAEFDIINRPGWSKLQAVRSKQVIELMHEMNRTIFSFYPCLVLAKTFYPDEFAGVDPEALLADFFDRYTLIESDMGVWQARLQ